MYNVGCREEETFLAATDPRQVLKYQAAIRTNILSDSLPLSTNV